MPGIEKRAVLVARRDFHHQRAGILQVVVAEGVDDVVVAGLQRLVDLQALVEHEQLHRLYANPPRAFGHRGEPDQRLAPDIGLHGALVVEFVVKTLAGFPGWIVARLEGELRASCGRRLIGLDAG
ncbi:hypothetical protein D3C80_1597950 [compost metagenome]